MKPLDSSVLRGNWATLLLATDDRGRIDYDKLGDEIDVLIASHPDGIYSNGTAGEFYSLEMVEFVRVCQMLSDKCERAGVPYQIGVSHPCAQASVERLLSIKDLHPGAVQVILPDWFPVTDAEAEVFLCRMAELSGDIPLVLYNPPHAKRVLSPSSWGRLKEAVPSLIGVKVSDQDCSESWYEQMNAYDEGLSVFIPGHHLATGVKHGAHGAYSNVACLNPFAAQRWSDLMLTDMDAALELEQRIRIFMQECIDPFILESHYSNHACDRFMANVGGWASIGANLRWPYSSIPITECERVRRRGHDIIPEFL